VVKSRRPKLIIVPSLRARNQLKGNLCENVCKNCREVKREKEERKNPYSYINFTSEKARVENWKAPRESLRWKKLNELSPPV
jgi:hypothetical protein